jgi:phosphoribosyl-ATP pyrophosphohydrolase
MLAKADIRPQEVLDELARREGVSGLVEKASRTEK